jgi:hypothetical protein
MTSTSHKSDGEAPDHMAKEAKKAKQVEGSKVQQNLNKERDVEKKKKKDGEKKVGTTVREKTVVKKSRVPRALRIHSSNGEEEGKNPEPKDTPRPKEVKELFEEDQTLHAEEGGASIPQGTLPQQDPTVENQVGIDDGQDKGVQNDSPHAEPSIPNVERSEDAPAQTAVEGKEVNTILLALSHFLFTLTWSNRFSFEFKGRLERQCFSRRKTIKSPRGNH